MLRVGQDGNGKLTGKEKETVETGLKRSRSASLAAATGPQRVPLGPGKAPGVATASQVQARVPSARVYRPQVPIPSSRRVPVPQDPPAPQVIVHDVSNEDHMDVEEHAAADVVEQYMTDEADLTELSDREEDVHPEDDEAVQSEDEEPSTLRTMDRARARLSAASAAPSEHMSSI